MTMPEYVNRKLGELRDSLYSLKEYIPSKRDIASGIAGGLLFLTTACASATPVQPVQTPTTPPVQPPAQTQTYTLQGTAYHDYNGDGIKEDNEPPIPGVDMDLYSGTSLIKSIKTDANGAYSIHMPPGDYELRVFSVLGYNNRPFRYINTSPAEFQNITDPLYFRVNGDTVYNVALMQGFLTLPFGPNTKFEGKNQFGIEFYMDEDFTVGVVRNWNGKTGQTYDNHAGTDFYMEENTPILAAAPGLVVPFPSFGPGIGKAVAIQHESPFYKFYSIDTIYGHLNTVNVKVGDKVKRGDVIGLSGKIDNPAFYSGKHLHFEIAVSPSENSLLAKYWNWTDPYRNITRIGLQNPGYWTKDNDPQYFLYP
jgi:hypothetical protein